MTNPDIICCFDSASMEVEGENWRRWLGSEIDLNTLSLWNFEYRSPGHSK
jgi:hypothetical protein